MKMKAMKISGNISEGKLELYKKLILSIPEIGLKGDMMCQKDYLKVVMLRSVQNFYRSTYLSKN